MAFLSRDALKTLLFGHVVELKFQRKRPTIDSKTRRMFCVGAYPNFHNNKFLNSINAMASLNYKLPKGVVPYHPRPYYNPDSKNLVITFDIFRGDYRSINVYRCNIIRAFPVDTEENIKKFWEYFNKHIYTMSESAKREFFNK